MLRNVTSQSNRRKDQHKARSANRFIDPGFRTTLVSGPTDPVQTTPDIIFQKKILLNIQIQATTQGGFLRPVDVTQVLPPLTQAEGYYMVRFLKLSFYGDQEASYRMTVFDTTTDLACFMDQGTRGHQRAQIHIRPSFEVRQRWFQSNDDAALYRITFGSNGATSAGAVAINVSLEIRVHSDL